MDKWIDGQIDLQMDRQIYRWIDGQMDIIQNGWIILKVKIIY